MSSLNKRLDRLGDHLSPTDIVLRWLKENLKPGSMNELVETLAAKPHSAWPLFRLPSEAERAAKSLMSVMPQDEINASVRQYVRDTVFLWRLHLEINYRIDYVLRRALPLSVVFLSRLRIPSHNNANLSGTRDAWRCLPYPLDAETAAAVAAALEHRVESWNCLQGEGVILHWVFDDPDIGGVISDEKLTRTVRRIDRELRSLVRSKVLRHGRLVWLPTSPLPFFETAPLINRRWIDMTVLELAEMGAILTDAGFTCHVSGDPHRLVWNEFKQPNSQGEPTPIDDAVWHQTRRAAAARVRAYRGRRRVIDGRHYVEFALYQRSRKRSLGNRLDAWIETGFVVSDWNDWVKRQDPDAALADIAVRPLAPLVAADAWTVHDADRARSLQSTRASLIADLRPDKPDPDSSTAVALKGDSTDIASRDDAIELLVEIEGLASAVDRMRAHYFKNHEIVFADLADSLDLCRTGFHIVLSRLEDQRGGDDSWIARLIDPSIPDEGESADPDYADHEKRVQERIAQTAGNTTRELVHQAHFEALDFVGEFRAAQAVIDKELEALFG